jgi:hypothetical protein
MGTAGQWLEAPIAGEFEGAELGDARRTRRLQRVAVSAADAPGVGFPQMVADDSELEGVYRFLGNEEVQADQILEPHVVATVQRAREAGFCLVVHDTTDFRFGGEHRREGLGHINSHKQQGFFGRFALALLPGEARVPLGVCGLVRHSRQIRKGTRRKSWWEMSKDPTRESLRWTQLVAQVEARRKGFECIHLMDREGDVYDLIAQMRRIGARFVVRGAHDRALSTGGRLHQQLRRLRPRAHRNINIALRADDGRSESSKQKHPTEPIETPEELLAASIVLSGIQVQLLTTQLALAEPPCTAEQAAYAVAKLGGHLRRNGPPGWQTLGRGFERLFWMQAGWLAANPPGRSDQS